MVVNHKTRISTNAVTVNYNRLFHATWVYSLNKSLISTPYMDNLQCYIDELYKATDFVFPRNKEDIFRAYELVAQARVKVVIFGNEPYQSVNSNGLAFGSFKTGRGLSSMLQTRKIQNCLHADRIDKAEEFDTTLRPWVRQGVFLLNTALTVESMKPASHLRYWSDFINKVVYYIANNNHCIWVLWGKKAGEFQQIMPKGETFQVKGYTMENIKNMPNNPYWNYVLTAPHPASEAYNPSGAGFYGCNHFNLVNAILDLRGQKQINW